MVTEEPNLADEASWTAWASALRTRSFTETILSGLETNIFTRIKMRDLPIGLTQIIKAVKRSQNELLEEAFGFCIMGRNLELVSTVEGNIDNNVDVSRLHPVHLATAYLDGSKQCCNILDCFVMDNSLLVSVHKLYRNDLGHTILDNLMITILRSHTSCSADTVGGAFTKSHRFAGEEVDICVDGTPTRIASDNCS
jgi:hypothetical protein